MKNYFVNVEVSFTMVLLYFFHFENQFFNSKLL